MASFYNHYYRFYRPYSMPQVNYCEPKKVCPTTKLANNLPEKEPSFKEKENSFRSFSFGPVTFKNPFFNDIEEPLFEIFGIQLYLDDIIILGLLFFLYQEGVQDEMLFMALILLLVG